MTTKLQILRKKYASWIMMWLAPRFPSFEIQRFQFRVQVQKVDSNIIMMVDAFLTPSSWLLWEPPLLPVVGRGRWWFYLWTAVDSFKRLHMVCYFINLKPSPTTNTSQTKDSLNTERKMQLSKVVLFLASMFAIVLAAPYANVSLDSSTTSSTYIWSSLIPLLERGDSSSESRA